MAKERINKINEELRRELSAVLREVKDTRIPMMTSVVAVNVTNDLSYAKIYVSVMGDEDVQKKALEGIQAIMDAYNIGVEIVKVSLQRVEPPASVIDAFRDVERAQADQQSERNRAEAYARDTIARTRGLVAEKINYAEAEKAKLIAKAKGETERFNLVYESYKSSPSTISKIMKYDTFNAVYSGANKLVIDKDIKSLQHMSIPQSYLATGDKQ